MLNMMKGKHLQPRLLYPARLSFRFEGESKTFSDKQKVREFRTSIGRKEQEKRTEKIIQEIIAKNFPNMGKESLTQIQEAQRVPYKINPRRNTPRHIVSN